MKLKSKLKNSWLTWLIIIILVILVIMISCNSSGEIIPTTIYITLLFAFYSWDIYLICSEEKNFNKSSLYIFFAYFVPLFLLLCLEEPKLGKNEIFYGIIAIALIFPCSIFGWLAYFARCIKMINKIKRERFLFSMKSIKSMLSSLLVFFSGTIVILSLFGQNFSIKIWVQIFSLVINSIFPLIDMYTYVHSELDKYLKENVIIYN
ncbi:MAG: hypothetical protein M3Z87_12225 [Lactobacillus sp.]|nr:hypothetical protein [Lactobacillus sp.]